MSSKDYIDVAEKIKKANAIREEVMQKVREYNDLVANVIGKGYSMGSGFSAMKIEYTDIDSPNARWNFSTSCEYYKEEEPWYSSGGGC
jgi:hypothetical protein